VGNNLAAYLDGAPADAHHARVLFLVLGLPGVILSVLLAVAATTLEKTVVVKNRHYYALVAQIP
jgi:putative ABC transport system permease protein